MTESNESRNAQAPAGGINEFVAFWNEVLVEKFERFRNILLEGLSYHSEVPLSNLSLAPGSKARGVVALGGATNVALCTLIH